ncbi:MAG: wax ester/triacylglycerol synthase family O-acyltransferase [Chloroflexi bacterium]|nr:MAG: wax ester/triacylglycerol synthase family O-acyltransferase [Chloroflexota bacterium]
MSPVEPLSPPDAAWLRMEDPTNLMMITGILTFKKPIDFEHLKAVIKYRLLKYDRFRYRVVIPKLPLASPYWEPDPNFELKAHLHRIALPSPGDHTALQELVSDFMSTPLDYTKPLWQIHLVEGYGEGCALLVRIHHCIADGMALVQVLLSLTDLSPDSPWPQPDDEVEADTEERGGALDALFKQASNVLGAAGKLTGKLVSESLDTLVNPARMLELALQSTDTALAASRLVLRTPDPKTIFKGELGVAKRAAWTRPIPLADIKAIKNVTGGTVNDVLISAMTGALRRYMVGRGENVEGLNFRAAVPVNLRTPEEMGTLGNKFGLVFLSLPVGIEDPLERLAEVRKRMEELKKSQEAPVAFGILNAMGMSPAEIQKLMVEMFAMKATAVMTNVPGPQFPLYFAGQKIDGIMFWVPQSGHVSLGISILSYAGKVFMGVATDAGLVPDPDKIVAGFYAEYDALMDLVRQAEEIEQAEQAEQSEQVQAAAVAAEAAAQPEDDPHRCQAVTKSGRRCRNRALDGMAYCHVHQKTAVSHAT